MILVYLLVGLFALVIIGLVVSLPYLMGKSLKQPLIGGFFSFVLGIFLFMVLFFPETTFTENDAKDIVAAANITLSDDIDITCYEHPFLSDCVTFCVEVSDKDIESAICAIKQAPDYIDYREDTAKAFRFYLYNIVADRYFGEKQIRSFRSDRGYIRQVFEPSGKEGYAPKFDFILIVNDRSNTITYELINI